MPVQRFLDEVISAGNIAAADTVCTTNLVWHGASVGELPNLEVFKHLLSGFFAAFSDLQATIEDLIAEEDKVAVRQTWRGTHTGNFQDIPPTGKQVTFTSIETYRIVAGKLAEEWVELDMLGLMQQLGVIPQME